MHKKAQGQWGMIVKASMAALVIIVGYFFVKTYLLERGGGAVEKTGFGPFEDADQDGIQNFQDQCCPAACNPGGRPVEKFGDFRGCVKCSQGVTPCTATACNPAPPDLTCATAQPTAPVAATPPQPTTG